MRIIAALFLVPLTIWCQSIEQGITEVRQGHISEAKAVFESVLKADTKNAEAYYQLGLIFLRRDFRNEDEAVDHMEQAVDLVPNNADYQYGYGAALGSKAQNAGVIKQAFMAPKIKKAFLRAVELNPRHFQARIGLAQYYLKAPSIMGGDDEQGWKQIEEAIRLDEVQGRIVKSDLLRSEKKFVEAEAELKTLTLNMPKSWIAWRSLGYFYYRQKEHEKAIEAMNRFVSLRPDTADSFKSLAEVQLQKGDNDAALMNLKKSLLIDKDFITAHYLLGRTFEAKGMKKEARDSYQRVLELNPGDNLRKLAEKNLKDLSS